jgi:magnesium transporter
MMTYWQTIPDGLLPIQSFKRGCIVNTTDPSEEEKHILQSTFKIPEDVIADIMDVDERSRIEIEDDKLIIILRIPIQNSESTVPFSTIPMGIIISDEYILVLCQSRNDVLTEFFTRRKKTAVNFLNKADFILSLFLHTTNIYHRYLKHINIQTNIVEQDLERSTKNEELQKLLRLEKCLVYFTTSLRSNEFLLAKLKTSKFLRTNEFDVDLLEDVLIENKQAIEMAKIYSDIQTGMMDAFASVISNNLNIVMKQLTIITIVLAIPTMVASFFGMNVPNHFENSKIAFYIVLGISILMGIFGVLLIRKKRWI